MHYLCQHEKVNDLDNSNHNGTFVRSPSLPSAVLHWRDGEIQTWTGLWQWNYLQREKVTENNGIRSLFLSPFSDKSGNSCLIFFGENNRQEGTVYGNQIYHYHFFIRNLYTNDPMGEQGNSVYCSGYCDRNHVFCHKCPVELYLS